MEDEHWEWEQVEKKWLVSALKVFWDASKEEELFPKQIFWKNAKLNRLHK